ncbi:hypothetical protein FQA39_LY19391 [Lamprigera yunnana]|nr:hypothetical protein FQA39_LY19391 [Lamprigera yunnana]
MGVQIADSIHFFHSSFAWQQQVRHGQEDAQNHDQCVVIDITRLQPAHQGGDAADNLPGAVNDCAINQRLVAHLPEHGAQHARASGEDVFIDPVHAVLAFQRLVEARFFRISRLMAAGILGLDHVEHIRRPLAAPGQARTARPGKLCVAISPAVDFFRSQPWRPLLGSIHGDDTLEEVTKQHGHTRHAHRSSDRGNGQRHIISAEPLPPQATHAAWHRGHGGRHGDDVHPDSGRSALCVKNDEVQAERIERRDEHTRQHSEVGKASLSGQIGGVNGFDDRVLGVKKTPRETACRSAPDCPSKKVDARCRIGDMRETMKIPAVTMVAAWSHVQDDRRLGSSHRIGSQAVARGELRRLAHGADEQTDGDHRHQQPAGARQQGILNLGQLGEYLGIAQRAGVGGNQANAQDEAEVTHTVDHESLHVGEDRGLLLEVKTDQQVRHQATASREEELQQVVAHQPDQHREGEQRDVREEAVVTIILCHVAHGVDVHHQRHKGHHAHHHRGEGVDHEADFHLQRSDRHPGVEGLVEACAFKNHTLESHRRNHKCDQHAQDRQRATADAANTVTT